MLSAFQTRFWRGCDRGSLGGKVLGCLAVGLVSACHPQTPTFRVDHYGVYVNETAGHVTVVRSGRRGVRTCTGALSVPLLRGQGDSGGEAPTVGYRLEVAFFHLCEALGNGDISQDEYRVHVRRLLLIAEHSAAHRSEGSVPRREVSEPSIEQPTLLAPWPGLGPTEPPRDIASGLLSPPSPWSEHPAPAVELQGPAAAGSTPLAVPSAGPSPERPSGEGGEQDSGDALKPLPNDAQAQ